MYTLLWDGGYTMVIKFLLVYGENVWSKGIGVTIEIKVFCYTMKPRLLTKTVNSLNFSF